MNGISNIQKSFQQQKALVGYLTAGDGGVYPASPALTGIEKTLCASLALIDGGVNILEIGVPFSDPIADGPVIQRAAARALESGTTLTDVLWLAENIRKKSHIPLIVFSYLNPILAVWHSSFFEEAKKSGIDGILLVDCPIEESAPFHDKCLNHGMAPIFVIAPSTPLSRIHRITDYGQGFLYYACRKGTTGMRSGLPEDFAEKMQRIQTHVNLPVVAGFGISEISTAKAVLEYADGVVIGSLFVKALEDGMSMDALTQLVNGFRT